MENENKSINFEEAINELDEIVGNLDKGNLTLDNALDEFKKGIEIYKKCQKKLEETEGKVKLILDNEEIDFEGFDL